MLSLSRIVVPVDFSDQCRGVLRYAKVLAEGYGSQLTLLHVVNPVYTIPATGISGPAMIPVPRSLVDQQAARLDQFGVDELDGIAVRRLVYEGDTAEQIVEFIHTEGMDLVAMPTHGLGGLRRFLIGSVTAKILHEVDCPVFTGVHMNQRPHDPSLTFSRVLCAVDLDSENRATMVWAAQFASDFAARLSIVHAVPALSPEADVSNRAREDLAKMQITAGAENAAVYIEEGEPAKAVSSVAEESRADLVVIGRGSRQGPAGRLGTNADAIIRESPCPVVSVYGSGASTPGGAVGNA